MAERVTITSEGLTAEIAPLGAELQSLRTNDGRELMHGGDPRFWSGRAPLLFPIVGRLNGDAYRLDGRSYPMSKHGFARRSVFALVDHAKSEALFRLTDSSETQALYPFAFALDARFAVDAVALSMTVTVRNTGSAAMPASFGFHPAFAWPLPFGAARADHRIVFDREEPAGLRAITTDGLIAATIRPSPVEGQTLALADALFADDALVWTELNSHELSYGAPGFPELDIGFPDTEWLGVWTKPGAPFVCVEPWAGVADPEGYAGDFREKPGVFEVAPGGEQRFRMTVALTG